jgi:CHAT domain-containing protein
MRLYQIDKSADHLAATLEKSEQSRARSLMDILTEARANIHRAINVSEDLLRREHEIQLRLNAKARVEMELLNRKHSKEEAANIEREVDEAIREYDAVKATIRVSSPDYAQLTQAQSLTVSEIQQLLDDDTLLLEYFLGEERSYLWLVSRTSITGVASLPKRSEIEKTALAFYKSLTQLSPRPTSGKALSQMLLGPVADRLGTKRLLIVGDGLLQYLPFAALPSPSGRVATPYLIEEHELVYLPSASVLRVLRTQTGDRKPAPLSVAVLADPVFGPDDGRLNTNKQTSQPDKVAEQASSFPNLRDKIWVPLPATEKEADDIVKAIPPPARKEIFSGFNASRATVMKLQDEGYRIVHFATHGDLNTEHPELSSIVLSLLDSRGEPQDGFLRLHDIYNLKLPADLIVLSACTTGLGRIIKGEGLIGLTRGFMHAGAPRVVASLWRIEDLGTSELMKRFYQHLAKDRMSPPLALRQAQVDMLRSRRWRSPYFWAGFVIQGEWRAIPIAQ